MVQFKLPNTPVLFSFRKTTLAYEGKIVQQDLEFDIRKGSIFAIMGGSGCGKSTLMRSMVGLLKPVSGKIEIEGHDYWGASSAWRKITGKRFGVLFQSGALWSSLTVGENVALPMQLFTHFSPAVIVKQVRLKLALVGMSHVENQYPAELSGGMRKRAGLARALSLDPDILFFDEPSAGLDPVTSLRLDELILSLREGLGVTIILVSHELPSLLTIADDGIFLDGETHTALERGSPSWLRQQSKNPKVLAFMRRTHLFDQDRRKTAEIR